MLKRIIVLCILYTVLMLILILNSNKTEEIFTLWIGLISLIFIVFVFREVYLNYIVVQKPQNIKVTQTHLNNTELNTLKKISTHPFFFGFENKLINDEEFYFDAVHFYAITPDSKKAVFKLADIIELSKTSTIINNRHVWQVKIQYETDQEVIFKFTHNYTVWNKDFLLFYEEVKRINPEAIKSKWNLWTR